MECKSEIGSNVKTVADKSLQGANVVRLVAVFTDETEGAISNLVTTSQEPPLPGNSYRYRQIH
jgi:hypothetical protein